MNWEQARQDSRQRDMAFDEKVSRMTIRELETARFEATSATRYGIWRGEVETRRNAGRVTAHKAGLRAGPNALSWEVEREGLCEVTPGGMRVHDSVRQHGGEETARRCLVVGHRGLDMQVGYQNDLFHLDVEDAQALRDALDRFLKMSVVSGGGARRTAGDDACRALPPWEDPEPVRA